MSFRSLFKQIANQAVPSNYQNVLEACGRTFSAVSSAFSNDKQIHILDASKVNKLRKCDSCLGFSLYAERSDDPLYIVVYVPRFLSIFRTKHVSEAEKIRMNFNSLMDLISFIEESSSNDGSFIEKMEKLRCSVLQHPGYRCIHHTCACGFTDAVFALCADVEPLILLNEPSDDGFFPLQIAAYNNHEDTLVALLNLGASISKQDCRGCSVVHYAAQKSYKLMEILSKCSSFKTSLDLMDENGQTPLCYCLLNSQYKCAELLLKAGCSKGPYKFGPLISLLPLSKPSSELLQTIKVIMQYYPTFLSEKFDGLSTVLHKPMNSMVLKYLLKVWWSSLDVNVINEYGETPLHCSVRRGELSQSLSLLAYDTKVNAIDKHGNTPLHYAIENGLVDVVKLLLVFGANVFRANNCGIRPVDLICSKNCQTSSDIEDCIKIFTLSNGFEDTATNCFSEFAQNEAIDAVHSWLKSNNKPLINVLSLDGGGIKGLVTIQILIHIQKHLETPIMDYFSWLAGTSTGAIIALYFVKGGTLEGCRRLYLMLKDEIFPGTRPYSEAKLESLLKNHFGNSTPLSQLKSKKVLVTATSIETNPPKLKLFRNYCLPLTVEENRKLGYQNPEESIIWKCARYSCAAPTFFPPMDGLADGGLIANNPTLDLLSDIAEYNTALAKTKQAKLHLGCVLSLGTGRQPEEVVDANGFDFRIPNNAFHGYNMICDALKFMDILKEQLTSSDGECVRRARCFSHGLNIPFFRFSPPLSLQVQMDDESDKTAVQCLWDTEKYLRTSGAYDVISLVTYLKSLEESVIRKNGEDKDAQVNL